MNNYYSVQQFLNTNAPVWIPVVGFALLLVVLWSLFWKGLALWHSAQRGEQWWFLAILVLNTAGILEIVYLFAVAKTGVKGLFTNHGHKH